MDQQSSYRKGNYAKNSVIKLFTSTSSCRLLCKRQTYRELQIPPFTISQTLLFSSQNVHSVKCQEETELLTRHNLNIIAVRLHT